MSSPSYLIHICLEDIMFKFISPPTCKVLSLLTFSLLQTNPFDGSSTPKNLKGSGNKVPNQAKDQRNSRRQNFADKANNAVQINSTGPKYNLKNLVPTEFQGIYYNISEEEDSESCCCNNIHCELCIAEQYSLGISNQPIFLRSNVATQIPSASSSPQINGNNNVLQYFTHNVYMGITFN